MASKKWIGLMLSFLFLLVSSAFCDDQQSEAPVSVGKSSKPLISTPQNIDKVQQQLKDVLASNQKLQEDYMKRIDKMKAISDQARIHQQILDKIKKQTPTGTSAVQQAVQQEKIRLIAEQARKNQELLKALRASKQQTP